MDLVRPDTVQQHTYILTATKENKAFFCGIA